MHIFNGIILFLNLIGLQLYFSSFFGYSLIIILMNDGTEIVIHVIRMLCTLVRQISSYRIDY